VLKIIFPIYHLLTVFIIPLLVIVSGFKYNTSLSADLSLIHSILFMVFFPLNGNVRHYILNSNNTIFVENLIWFRLLSYIPLFLLSIILCLVFTDLNIIYIFLIVFLGSLYWLNELFVSLEEKKTRYILVSFLLFIFIFLIYQITFATRLIADNFFVLITLSICLLIILVTISIEIKNNFNFKNLKTNIKKKIIPQISGTFIVGLSSFIFKTIILYFLHKDVAGTIFIAFTISGSLLTFFTYGIGPSIISSEVSQKSDFVYKFIKGASILSFILGIILILLQSYGLIDFIIIANQEIFVYCMSLCFLGIPFSVFGQYYKLQALHQNLNLKIYKYDAVQNITVLPLAIFCVYFLPVYFIGLTYLYTGLLYCLIYRNYILRNLNYHNL